MKLLSLFIFGCFMTLHADVFSQQAKVNLQVQKMQLDEVLKELSRQTEIDILFNSNLIKSKGVVNLEVKEKSITQVLDELLPNLGLEYEYDQTLIIVKERKFTPVPQQNIVTGVVTDEDKNPLPGVTVVIKGTTVGTFTDAQGRFKIALPDLDGVVLVFSFIGHQSVEIKVKNTDPLNVVMKETAADIDEVVVTGIFARRKETYTGSYTTIKSEELEMFRGQNLIHTLANIDPSIYIPENNAQGKNPNYLPEISIRGGSTLPMSVEEFNQNARNELNTPLIIMDGFEISLTRLMDYNDHEIESINILKDAAATAIYGSRGANGVIVIISKSPALGKLRFGVTGGWSLEIPDLTSFNLLDAAGYLELQNKIGLYSPTGLGYLNAQQTYASRLKEVQEGVNTYWMHYPLRVGVSQRYNARLEGGSREFRWAANLGFNHNAGVMKKSQRDNFNGVLNMTYTSNKLTVRNNLSISLNESSNSPYGSFSTYSNMPQYYRAYDDDGFLIPDFVWLYSAISGANRGNPLYDATLNVRSDSRYTGITNNFSLDWNVLQGLYVRTRIGLGKTFNESDSYTPPDHSRFLAERYQTAEGFLRKGSYNHSNSKQVSYDANVTVSYSKVLAEKHQIYGGIDFSIRESSNVNYSMSAEGFQNALSDFYGSAYQYTEGSTPSGSESKSRAVGFTANANYSYADRYFVDGSYRVDGSSQFGRQEKFAPFYSVGIGWNIHNEKFFKSSNVVRNLRLRVTYGATGSQNFSPYQALPIYRYNTRTLYTNQLGANLVDISNDGLRWQTTYAYNFGLDGDLFGRFKVGVDYYINNTKDMLSDMEIPHSTGYTSYIANIGTVRNTGVELSVSTNIIEDRDGSGWFWSVSTRISNSRSEIIKLSQSIKDQVEAYNEGTSNVSTLFYEGYSMNSLWAVRSLGIDPSTGEELYLNKEGQVTGSYDGRAKVYCGVGDPKFRGNLTSMIRYKNLTLSLNFGYQWGGKAFNSTLFSKVEITNSQIGQGNVDKRALRDRWSEPGDVTFFKAHSNEGTRQSTRFIMKNNYLQLTSANIQYRLATKFLRKINMDAITFSTNINDLFYLGSIKRERGTSYPFTRTIGCSLGVQF